MNLKIIGNKIVASAGTAAVYLPVAAGILTPMVWLLASWYFSWDLLGFILPFSHNMSGMLVIAFSFPESISQPLVIALSVMDVLFFFIGISLFLISLVEMIRAKVKKRELVTTGPYRYVRHPQHLGISFIFLGVSFIHLLFPFSYNVYIRPGDIIAWLFTTFLLITVADIEEAKLTREFGQEYEEYRARTSFMLPRIRLPFKMESKHLQQGKPLRYIIWFIVFWLLASGILFLSVFTTLYWTR